MFARLARAIPMAKQTCIEHSRANSGILSAPPKNKINSAEKFFYAVGMFGIICAYPSWVLAHIREYRGLKD